MVGISSNLPEQQYPYNWVFVFTLFLIFMMASLILVSSCSKTMQKHKHLSHFSVQSSLKIFKYNPDSRLNTLNGVKALAMMWVVFGH